MSEQIRVHRCGCPVFIDWRLHRYPCALVGVIDDERAANPTQPHDQRSHA